MECDLLNARTKDDIVPGVYCLFHNCRVQVGGERALEALGQVPGNVGNAMVTAMPGRAET